MSHRLDVLHVTVHPNVNPGQPPVPPAQQRSGSMRRHGHRPVPQSIELLAGVDRAARRAALATLAERIGRPAAAELATTSPAS